MVSAFFLHLSFSEVSLHLLHYRFVKSLDWYLSFFWNSFSPFWETDKSVLCGQFICCVALCLTHRILFGMASISSSCKSRHTALISGFFDFAAFGFCCFLIVWDDGVICHQKDFHHHNNQTSLTGVVLSFCTEFEAAREDQSSWMRINAACLMNNDVWWNYNWNAFIQILCHWFWHQSSLATEAVSGSQLGVVMLTSQMSVNGNIWGCSESRYNSQYIAYIVTVLPFFHGWYFLALNQDTKLVFLKQCYQTSFSGAVF